MKLSNPSLVYQFSTLIKRKSIHELDRVLFFNRNWSRIRIRIKWSKFYRLDLSSISEDDLTEWLFKILHFSPICYLTSAVLKKVMNENEIKSGVQFKFQKTETKTGIWSIPINGSINSLRSLILLLTKAN